MGDERNRCLTCGSWKTDEVIQRVYGEGEGVCEVTGEIVFCDKHNCSLYHNNREVESEHEQ